MEIRTAVGNTERSPSIDFRRLPCQDPGPCRIDGFSRHPVIHMECFDGTLSDYLKEIMNVGHEGGQGQVRFQPDADLLGYLHASIVHRDLSVELCLAPPT